MSNFEWQTDDSSWDESVAPPTTTAVSPTQRRYAIFALLGVVGVVLFGYGWLLRQAAQREEQLTADIVSSLKLLETAAQEQDVELFHTLVSGRDEQWLQTQTEVISRGLFLETPDLPLRYARLAPAAPTITFDPELTTAEVLQPFHYQTAAGQTITLTRTFTFRQGQQRWLYSPPSTDFWGALDHQVSTLPYISTHTFPTRDATLIEQLTTDLSTFLHTICETPEQLALCPNQLTLNLHWQSETIIPEPSHLFFYNTADGTYFLNYYLITPTLTGLPADEVSYQELLQAYQTHLLTNIFNLTSGPTLTNTDAQLIHNALLEWQLAQLNLQPWPLTTADYQTFFNRPFPPDARAFHLITDEQLLVNRARLLVEFAMSTSADSSREKLQALRYQDWATTLFGAEVPQVQFQRFTQFIHQRSQPRTAAVSDQQQIQTLCRPNTTNPRAAALYTFDPATAVWESQPKSPTTIYERLFTTPQDQATILYEFTPTSPNQYDYRLLQIEKGQTQLLYENSVLNKRSIPLYYAEIEQAVFAHFNADANGDFLNYAFDLVDLDSCAAGQCTVKTITTDRIPNWSSDGRFMILRQPSSQQLNIDLADQDGQPLIRLDDPYAEATWWLADGSFAYPRRLENRFRGVYQEVIRGSTNPLQAPEPWLTAATLSELIPNPETGRWRPANVFQLPHEPDVILLSLRDSFDLQTYQYFYNWRTKEVVKQVDLGVGNVLSVSPNGRWLLWTAYAATSNIHLIDLQEKTIHTTFTANFPTAGIFDWSLDGEWLLRFDAGFLVLHHPTSNQQFTYLYPDKQHLCRSGGWIMP